MKNIKDNVKLFWGLHSIPQTDTLKLTFGDLHIWLKRSSDELWITYQHSEINQTMDENDLNWHRWVVKNKEPIIEIKPAFPDYPVVVKPEHTFRINKNVNTKIYVRVPLWLQVFLDKTLLFEIPSVILSKTWFGNFVNGELCYWISSSARKDILVDPDRPYMSLCPVAIINKSKDELLIEKICLRVNQLALFIDGTQLWGGETKISFHGIADGSEIDISAKVPNEIPKAKLINSARQEVNRGFRAKTFMNLKELPGFGFLDW